MTAKPTYLCEVDMTRRRSREERAILDGLRRRFPPCVHCRRPVVAGQRDGLGRPAHHLCTLALWRHRRFREKAHPNPKLRQVEEDLDRPLKAPDGLPGTGPGTKGTL